MKTDSLSFRISAVLAALLLCIMGSLMLYRAATETTIVDETPHIAAGYTYTLLQDYRLNPEHPPLLKMLAAVPLAFMDLSFPTDSAAWTEKINGQWDAGIEFLFGGANDAVSITFWTRLAPLLLTLSLGVLLFFWSFERAGALGALFATTLFAFSPTFLAHGPLVTTDAAAAFGALLATYFLIRWLQEQTWRNLLFAGIAFGVAQLLKFSMILLVPYFGIAILLWILLKDRPFFAPPAPTRLQANTYEQGLRRADKATKGTALNVVREYFTKILSYSSRLILIGLVGLVVIYPVYAYTIADYPSEEQYRQSSAILESSPYPAAAQATVWASDKPLLRPYAQFALGQLMVFQRVEGGNTVYFLGDVAKEAWLEYFPIVFALKVPLALLVMLTGALIFFWTSFLRGWRTHLSEWGSRYAVEVILWTFPVLYWGISMLGNLNIGIRHVLPTFPFIYLVLAVLAAAWVRGRGAEGLERFSIPSFFKHLYVRWLRFSILFVLLVWYVLSSLSAFPHSLAYFNELTGGPSGGYRYVTDSNLDWGQDLRRLADYVKENDIDEVRLHYFGTADPAYFLGNTYVPFENTLGERHGWIAVSATNLQEGRATPAKGYNDKPTDYYRWLDAYEPRAIIGHSIFVYYIR